MKFLFAAITLFAFLAFADDSTSSRQPHDENHLDCEKSFPEMPGYHNMVIFGDPSDQLYAYHLPLFAGRINGEQGHVLMHVYQGLWSIQFDEKTHRAYQGKFLEKQTLGNPLPLFSIAPRGTAFRVPEMVCSEHGFSTDVLTVYGHVEGNPEFAAPERLANHLSILTVDKTLFAQRFEKLTKKELTYILFGTAKKAYLAHFLTDDENSFDQIVAIELQDHGLKQTLGEGGTYIATVSRKKNTKLEAVEGHEHLQSDNNKWKLPSQKGEIVALEIKKDGKHQSLSAQILSEVYFNQNADLSIE